MSTQSSFQRNHLNDLFSTLLNAETASTSGSNLQPDYSLPTEQRRAGQRQTRPFSEVLKPESFVSPETEALDKWYEDLQQYERNLETMASASVDPKFKEEVQHVDQWFSYLNQAERTATIYTLLQHSSQVQIRFFATVLQQMSHRDPLGTLLPPPEKVDTQLAGAMAKAELEASQKLISVLPYQTGKVINRPSVPNRQPMDRHSFAIGDTEEYDRMFTQPGLLKPTFGDTRLFEPSSRPKSVLLDSELSSIFSQDWPYTAALDRPKSADVSQWSFHLPPNNSSNKRETDLLPTWPAKVPFAENGKNNNTSDIVEPSFNHWSNNRRSRVTSSSRTSVPSTVSEKDEKQPTSILLSMFDDNTLFKSEPFAQTTSPIPSQNQSRLSVPGAKQFGQFLNPNDRLGENEGYLSDHSDHSTTSKNAKKNLNGSRGKEKKNNDLVDMQILEDVSAWLRSLRLHKYNPIFETMKWQDMLKLDDGALLAKGVAALGARRKLLKVFDQVKAHCEANDIKY